MAPYRILAMDGGGIRGILTAVLLERLEEAHPGFLAQIDLFAGTSTGGLLALGLAAGIPPGEAVRLYEDWGPRIFARPFWRQALTLGGLIGAKYPIEPLKEALSYQFGARTLADLPRKVLVTTFDLDNEAPGPYPPRTWKAKFFHNYPGSDSDGAELMVDVGVRTSAAPTYFPVYQGYIDGGVVASNPSVAALAQALHPSTGGRELPDLVLLSLGTGHNPKHIAGQGLNWGLVQWAPRLVDLMLEGESGLADYQSRQILDERYLRLDPPLPEPIGMDAVGRIEDLKRIAAQVSLESALGWLGRWFE